MAELRNHQCPRCGGYLKVVLVRRPVYERDIYMGSFGTVPVENLVRYDEVEELGECFRCTGAY